MYNNILIAIQGEEGPQFLQKALELIHPAQGTITILHIKETGLTHYGYVDQLASSISKEQFIDYIHELAENQQKKIQEQIIEQGDRWNLNFAWRVREGSPAQELRKEVAALNYDLLILGTKPKAPGNTSSKVKEAMLKVFDGSILIIK
ncbi:universal stress protein [Desulforamulus ruminis]|uniref:UspA domain-containing protein n=1 Tax=Desulforamulus ruminis (strain ATCC 23193 / DSM 2154 / NCIMB 8452 / DL) TaxID=696281 RepID=F6DVC5_DESRL|nr:universal stress protein [Desulforamulus ruminis]AEG60278.1 UspA domain-containing protein [Desulforamulus ruminis DSM 2154]